jgi:hypothetical protein
MQDGRQCLVIDFCQASGAASQFMAAGNHGEQRLTDILDDAIRQYRVIFDDRTTLIAAGEITGSEYGNHSLRLSHGIQIHAPHQRMPAPTGRVLRAAYPAFQEYHRCNLRCH